MTAYRNSDMGKVRMCYERLTPEERSCMVRDSLTIAQASSIDRELQKDGLSLSAHYEELKRCVFDDKTDTLEEKVEAKRNGQTRNSDDHDKDKTQYGLLFTKQGDVKGDIITPIGGLSIAKHVRGDQVAEFGAAINYAQHVEGIQVAVFGAAINYAQHVGGSQGAVCGAAINYAQHVGDDQAAGLAAINYAKHVGGDQTAGLAAMNYAEEVVKSQYAFSGCAVNIAKRVGKNQAGLLNIITETIKGKQIGLFNYAKTLNKGAKQFGLVNLEAKHGEKTKKRWTNGPEKWWNPEISLFYRKAEEETAQETQKPQTHGSHQPIMETQKVRVEEYEHEGPAEFEDVPEKIAYKQKSHTKR